MYTKATWHTEVEKHISLDKPTRTNSAARGLIILCGASAVFGSRNG